MKLTEKYCDEIKKSGLPTFIWGAQEMAQLVNERLTIQDIRVKGFVVDDEYIENMCEVITRSYLIQNYSEYNIVCGHIGTFYQSEQQLKDYWKGSKRIYFFPDIFDVKATEPITEEFYKKKKRKFESVSEALADDYSKQSLNAFLQEKISGNYKMILPYVITPQYFFKGAPWKYKDDEILFDCGAYDGDSIRDFIDKVDGYKKIIACEPDRNNYEHLLDNIEMNNWKHVVTYMMGVSNKCESVKFRSSGDVFSQINENGNEEISVDTIDNLSNGEGVSIIKMDIEGFELRALEGAENIIKKHRPILMISAYHKKDDIYNLFWFIRGIVGNYSYFFRCHRPHPIDAVLYAIPNERLK